MLVVAFEELGQGLVLVGVPLIYLVLQELLVHAEPLEDPLQVFEPHRRHLHLARDPCFFPWLALS